MITQVQLKKQKPMMSLLELKLHLSQETSNYKAMRTLILLSMVFISLLLET